MYTPLNCHSITLHVRQEKSTCSSSSSLLLAASPSVMVWVCFLMIVLWAPSCLFCSLILHDSSEAHTSGLALTVPATDSIAVSARGLPQTHTHKQSQRCVCIIITPPSHNVVGLFMAHRHNHSCCVTGVDRWSSVWHT